MFAALAQQEAKGVTDRAARPVRRRAAGRLSLDPLFERLRRIPASPEAGTLIETCSGGVRGQWHTAPFGWEGVTGAMAA